jgi:poly-beta-1,6-N-acetyl-D-glucosamine synthase
MYMELISYINYFFLMYACVLICIYIGIAILSFIEIKKYINRNRYVDYNALMSFYKLPSVSIIAPAYNDSRTIVENILCLLNIQYQNFEIIIVNDGSSDNTLETLIERFELVKVHWLIDQVVDCGAIKAIYKSPNSAYRHLVIVDKEYGGSADALNAGINLSQKELFLALNINCIVEPDALLRLVKPFLDSRVPVVASGGVARIVNSCDVVDGKIIRVHYPTNFWVRFQIIEYFRSFTMGRMAWSKLDGLNAVSGTFGLFDKKRVIKVGGYDKNSVVENMELVIRLRRYMYEVEKVEYKVAFIPDQLCWSEVSETYKNLSQERIRWTKGSIDTVLKHKKIVLNCKYGIIGLISFPYYIFFECLSPLIHFVGIVYFVLLTLLGVLNPTVFILLTIFVLLFSITYSMFAIFLETYAFDNYHNARKRLQASIYIFLEILIYQPINVLLSVLANYDYFYKRKWKSMRRNS